MSGRSDFMGMYAGRKIDLVALDVEGCITHGKRGSWDLDGIKKIRRYCDLAPQYGLPPAILVTGRSTYAEAVIQAIGALGDYFEIPSVIENGAMLWQHNEKRAEPARAAKDKLAQMESVRRFVDEDFRKPYNENNFNLQAGKEICVSLNPVGIDVEILYNIVREELGRAGFMDVVEVTYSSSAVDITPKGINKWSGLKQVLEEHGIDAENVLGVGDSKGDADWIKNVGIKSGPANATPDLRAIGLDHVSAFPEAEGVADILRYFILEPAGLATA